MTRKLTLIILLNLLFACAAFAQTTAFTYQGSLNTSGTPASGNYDFQFALFDAASGGAQLGSTLTRSTVAVANGVFAVSLDFGGQFPGANRFLDISVRTTGGGAFTSLIPRQLVNSAPYSVKSLNADNATNATQLGGLAPSAFIQNTTSPQAASNFNISGNGIFGGNVGIGTTTPNAVLNVVGSQPALSGGNGSNADSVLKVIGGTGGNTGSGNPQAMGGNGANVLIQGGDGGRNPAFDLNDGDGGSITLQPGLARSPAASGKVLLAPNGGNVGIGGNVTVGGTLGVTGNLTASNINSNNNMTVGGTLFGLGPPGGATLQVGSNIISTGNVTVGGTLGVTGNISASGTLNVNGEALFGFVRTNLAAAGTTPVCTGDALYLRFCSSSLRYKKQVQPFTGGLDIVNRLRPIAFVWKENGTNDLGLGAEDVAEVEPRLTFRNDKGEIEGIKYNQLSAVFINAIKEQQAQIETLRKANAALNTRLRSVEKRMSKTTGSARRHR